MIERAITPELVTLLGEYPVVTVLGPRQAGKTTLTREGVKGFVYSNLESPEVRDQRLPPPRSKRLELLHEPAEKFAAVPRNGPAICPWRTHI